MQERYPDSVERNAPQKSYPRYPSSRGLVGEFGGAAGNLSSLGKHGLQVQAGLMKELNLGQPEIAWHTMRDRIAEAGCFLGLVTGTLGKIALDVKLMMQTEVGEVFEPFVEGRGSENMIAAPCGLSPTDKLRSFPAS